MLNYVMITKQYLCLSFFSAAVLKHWPKATWTTGGGGGAEGLFDLQLIAYHEEKSGQNLKAETDGRN